MEDKMLFSEFDLSPEILEAINKKGFEEPTAIQALTIPLMLQDTANIVAQAQTGTGKTAAFGLPLLQMVDSKRNAVQALVLVPTRELAIQVSEEINSLKPQKRLSVAPIYGGQSIGQQLRRLKKGVHIVVGTPGRVIDHLLRQTLNISEIEHLILDEADEMLNMGFVEDIEKIMEYSNPDKRTLLFSATIPPRIKELAKEYMDGYEQVTVKKKQLTTNLTEQIYFEVRASDKFEALCRIIDIEDMFYGLIFCRTKNDVDELASHLLDRGYDAEAIHGDIPQIQRERTLNKFKKRQSNILVATDVAARGIDVNNMTHVINYALPQSANSYVHRIGRTGRAGNEGTAITFITPSEYKRLMFIQKKTKTDIKKSKLPTVKEIIKSKKRKIYEDLQSIMGEEIDDKYVRWSQKLLRENEAGDILSALLNYCFEETLNPEAYGEITDFSSRGRHLEGHGKSRLFVALGKKDRMNARKLVKMITKRTSIKGHHIDDVQVLDKFSFVTVPFKDAEEIIASFREKGKKPLITHVNKDKSGKKGSKKKGKRRQS